MLRAELVTTPEQVEILRLIRNQRRAGFAYDNRLIGREQQRLWWLANQRDVQAWLYRTRGRSLVGFGMLKRAADGRWWTTVAVVPGREGKGFGKAITADLVNRCGGRCWGAARRDNPAAVKLHVSAEWDVTEGPDPRLAYFRAKQ